MSSRVTSSRLPLVPLFGLTVFFPFLRDASPFFAHGEGARELVFLLELAFLACALADPKLRLPNPFAFERLIRWPLGIWIAWALLATLLSEHSARAWVRQTEWFLHLVTAGVLFAWLRAHPSQIRRVALSIPLGFIVLSFLIVAQLFSGSPPGGQSGIPGFENIRHYGYYAVVAIAYLAAIATTPKARAIILSFAAMAGAWSLLVWSGSRGSTVALVGSSLLLWLWKVDKKWQRSVGLVFVAIVLGTSLSLLLPRAEPSHGIQRILRHSGLWGEFPTHTTTSNFITNGRVDLWSVVVPQAVEHPWLGHGPDGFLHSGARGTWVEQPHNLVLQFLFEWGIVGAVAMLVLIAVVMWRQIQHVRSLGRREVPDAFQASRLGALGALVGLLLQSLVDGTLHHSFPLALAAVSLAICAQPAEGTPLPVAQQATPTAYRLVTALLAFVVLLNTWVMIALSNPQLPEPGAMRTQIVRAFPSRIESLGNGWSVFYWANQWSKTDPQLAIDWLHFGHQHAREPWRFYQLEGRLLLAQENRDAARAHFEKAIELSYNEERRQVSQEFLDRIQRADAMK